MLFVNTLDLVQMNITGVPLIQPNELPHLQLKLN